MLYNSYRFYFETQYNIVSSPGVKHQMFLGVLLSIAHVFVVIGHDLFMEKFKFHFHAQYAYEKKVDRRI